MHTQVLPNKYHFIDNLNINNIKNLDNKVALIYRNYSNKINLKELIKFNFFCKKTKRQFFISNHIELAFKYKLDGAYIPSFNKKFYLRNFTSNNKFNLIGSAHNYKEILIKQKQNVSLIFLSPLFKTEKKKNFLGIFRFINLCNLSNKPVIALGGINSKNIKLLRLIKHYGFAAINFYKIN